MVEAQLQTARKRQRVISPRVGRRLLAAATHVTDILSVLFGAYLAHLLRFGTGPIGGNEITAVFVAILILLFMFPALRASGFAALEHPWRGLKRVTIAFALLIAVLMVIGFGLQTAEQYSRLWVVFWILSTYVSLISTRVWWAGLLKHGIDVGFMREHVALVYAGGARRLDEIKHQLHRRQYVIEAVVPIDGEGCSDQRQCLVGEGRSFENASEFAQGIGELQLDRALLIPSADDERDLQEVSRPLRLVSLDVDVIPSGYDPALLGRSSRLVGEIPVVSLMTRPLSDLDVLVKRLEDLVLGSLFFILLTPVMAVIAVLIKLDSPGPVLFRQARAGFNNRPFTVIKFRSMRVHDDPQVRQAGRNDDRITRVGRFLRRTSLDELPQLLNVIAGDMSLVGPRPHALAHDREYSQVIDTYIARHRMKPGLTGWAQVNGWRGETETLEKMRKRIEHDLYYVDEWSLYFDLKIILMTPRVLKHENAY